MQDVYWFANNRNGVSSPLNKTPQRVARCGVRAKKLDTALAWLMRKRSPMLVG